MRARIAETVIDGASSRAACACEGPHADGGGGRWSTRPPGPVAARVCEGFVQSPIHAPAVSCAALRERALRAPAPGPRVGAADDDSASIDDEDISDSSVVGLAAVLEVLGGRVIEEKTTEGTY